jgi:hypothetical protein
MAMLRNTAFNEISVAITDKEMGEVEIGLTGFESEYLIYFSTREVAIRDLRDAADWLEGEPLGYQSKPSEMITRRTNYQQRKPFPKKLARPMSDKYLREELDAIVRLILPLMETCCFTCGTTKRLQVGHLVERRHGHTRFDTHPEGNNHRQCEPCNVLHEAKPTIYQDKFIARFGERAYADIQERAHSKAKLAYSDLLSLLEEKQEELSRLKGKEAA